MKRYVATFHTELSALCTQQSLKGAGIAAKRAPVPRTLSASCGTGLFYEAEEPCLPLMDGDFQGVYEICPRSGYRLLMENA